MKPVVVLATSLAAITQVESHGGLVIPPCRNNRGNVDLFNFTKATGEQWLSGGSCAVSCAHVPTACAHCGIRSGIPISLLEGDVACHVRRPLRR